MCVYWRVFSKTEGLNVRGVCDNIGLAQRMIWHVKYLFSLDFIGPLPKDLTEAWAPEDCKSPEILALAKGETDIIPCN